MGAIRHREAPRLIGRSSAPTDVWVARASGSTITDANGKRYIDFFMGWCVGNLGWGEPQIRARLARFRGPDYVAPGLQYAPWIECAERLVELAPGKLRTCYRATGGTEAVEIALQAAMIYTGRRKLVSIEGAYHGNSIAMRSIAGADTRKGYANLLSGCHTIKPPLDRTALPRVERALAGRDVAAFILEPVICNLGVLVPTQEFMEGLRKACTKYGTLLVFDEVACGFGRTGKLFATELFDVTPDLLCLATALTGGCAPMGATLMTTEVARGIADDFDFYSTYGWHPLGVEAAIATLSYWKRHQRALLRNVAERSDQFRERLSKMSWGEDAQVHVQGLAIAIELGDEERASRISDKCRRLGLLVSDDGDQLQLFPALTIDRETADKGLGILERCV
jgi:4-aminobutyrate aminotransferase-like enzyme